MNREQLIRALRRYARSRDLAFVVDTKKGRGSHYWVRVGQAATIVQDKLNPGRIERILKQLNVDPDEL